jgi:hypothetical protein
MLLGSFANLTIFRLRIERKEQEAAGESPRLMSVLGNKRAAPMV